MTTYTNEQLKQALAKMLPETLRLSWWNGLEWNPKLAARAVLDTELLYLCELVLNRLTDDERDQNCIKNLLYHSTWQQRTIAAAKVKGVEIV